MKANWFDMDRSWASRTYRLHGAAVNATAVAAFMVVILMAVLLAAPGHTVSAKYLNDLMVFLDGGHRVVSGQVPHRDFHAPLGPLVSLLPAAGMVLTGSLGAAMPAGVALLMLLLAPVIAHVLSSRLRPVLALPMAVYLSLILAAPANLGEDPQVLSFAMFYNRICWVTLSLLLIMCLPPIRGSSPIRDGCSAALLALVTLYTKASFGLVALVVLMLMLSVREQRQWAAIALATTAALTLGLEIVWGLPSAYTRDLLQAAYASGAVQGGSAKLLESFADNLFDYAAFALAAALATFVLRDWRMAVFLGFCASAGLLIQNQNFQVSGIVTLAAGAAVAAEALGRQAQREHRGVPPAARAAAFVLLAVLLVPTAAGRAVALGTHLWLASTKPAHRFALPRLDRVILAETGTAYDTEYSAKYAATLEDGARALALTTSRGPVVVLDFVNAFSVGLGYLPAQGDYLVSMFGRTFDMDHFLPAEIVLKDARVVMEPKWSLDPPATDAFLKLYAAYLEKNFVETESSLYWRIYRRRDDADATRSRTRVTGRNGSSLAALLAAETAINPSMTGNRLPHSLPLSRSATSQ